MEILQNVIEFLKGIKIPNDKKRQEANAIGFISLAFLFAGQLVPVTDSDQL